MGPSAGLLKTVGQELVENSQGKMKIGFSADLIFSGKNKKVGKIIKVNSVDLVYNPARGGKFVRSLNQSEEEKGTEKVLNSRDFSTPRNELGLELLCCVARKTTGTFGKQLSLGENRYGK